MKSQDIIFGTRPVLEAIKSGKTIEKIFIQKNLSKELFDEIKSNLAGKNLNISAEVNSVSKMQKTIIKKIGYKQSQVLNQKLFSIGKKIIKKNIFEINKFI